MDGKNAFGPYELLGRLSAGGMAEVHRARDTRPEAKGRIVALKTLHAGTTDDDLSRMFEDEARIANGLEHPHIARLYEWGSHDGQMFIAYELVEGKDLRVVFENAVLTGEAPPLNVVLYVIARIAEALAYAHARQASIVHRDVSPQNVVLSFEGDVKLIDFGIAKAKGRLSSTGAGTIKGKFGYMSPEQVRGEEVDQRTDVFSLGICAWELLTLRRLFLPSTLSAAEVAVNEILVLDMVKHHFPDPPSSFSLSVPKELDRIVMKALAKSPDERYKSARELYRDLYGFIEKTGLSATRDDVASMMRRTFGGTSLSTLRASEASKETSRSDKRTGRIMELQETRMSDENKGGSDLDIFEGLGKKDSQRKPEAPPPPPGSGQHVAVKPTREMKKTLLGIPNPAPTTPNLASDSAPSTQAAPPPSVKPPVPSRPPSGQMRAVAPSQPGPSSSPSKPPPPPPGRGSLPNLTASGPSSQPPQAVANATSPSATMRAQSQPPPIPPPASTRPGPAGVVGSASQAPQPAGAGAAKAKAKNGKLDMDWDDDDEATHVFDKEKEKSAPSVTTPPVVPEPERASMDHIMSTPPPPPTARTGSSQMPAAAPVVTGPPSPPSGGSASLSGAFATLGQSNGAPSASFKSGAPPSQSMRSAPPPPPNSGIPAPPPGAPQRSQSTSTHPIPPPPPGQTTTAPMHMPPVAQPQAPQQTQPGLGQQRPVSQPPHGHPQSQGQMPSHPPQGHHSGPPQAHSVPPQALPPVSRNMEATAVVPRAQAGGKGGLVVGLLLGIALLAGAVVFFLMPRTATLVVNVADSKGGVVKGLDVIVDDKSVCKETPCIVPNLQAGVHSVKVSAPGYEPLAPAAITIEARKDVTRDFTLTASKAVSGTGFKVSGNQPGVKLVVDGKDVGPLPQEMRDLEPGEHKLKFTGGDRYESMEKTITVAKDEIVDVGNVTLKVLKGKATINLGTPGAKVYLVSGKDRKEVPSFPMGIEFNPKEQWTLEATLLGHDDFKQPITWDDGQAEKNITVTLSPKGTTPPAVAPHPVAATPVTPAAPAQVSGVGAAKPAAPEKPAATTPAEKPEPAAKTEPAAKKEPAQPAAAGGEAFLNINSLPASTVVLDGKPLGPTPKIKVSVTPGAHTIMFVNAEQSLKKSITVDVKAGETKAAFAKLRD